MKTLKQYIYENEGDFSIEDILDNKKHQNVINAFIPGIEAYIGSHWPQYAKYSEDMLQEGIYGLLKAINNYDTDKSIQQFTEYAWKTIRGYIKMFIEKQSHTVRISASKIKKLKYKINQHNLSLQHLLMGDELDLEQDFNFHNAIIAPPEKSDISEKFSEHVINILKQKFKPEYIEMFCRVWKLGKYVNEKKNQKEIGAEYGVKSSTFNMRLSKMIEYLQKNLKMDDIEESLSVLPNLLIFE